MNPISNNQIRQWREETPGAERNIHFNNAGAALMPKQVLDTMIAHLQLETQSGGYEAAAAVAQKVRAFYQSVAASIGATPEQIAYMSSATEAYNKALSSIPLKSGDVIITSEDDYVSNQIAFLQLAKQKGIKLLRVPDLESGGIDLQALEALMKQHAPRLTAITHIPTNSGLIQDAEAIGKLCRQYDSWYLLDACQSFGQLPLDVEKIQCDFLSATFRKFMRGPRGAGFLYVSQRVLEAKLEPAFPDLHGANWVAADEYVCRGDAQKFEQWEKPYALLLGSAAAVDYAMTIGMELIRDRVQELSQLIRDELAAFPQIINLDKGRHLGGICSFTISGVDGKWLKQQLDENGVHSSLQFRQGALIDFERKKAEWAIRLSPHYYNTVEEIARVKAVFARIAQGV